MLHKNIDHVNVKKVYECRGQVPHIIDLHMGLSGHVHCRPNYARGKSKRYTLNMRLGGPKISL